MKTMKLLLALIAITGIISCEKNNEDVNYKAEVEMYIHQLKEGRYESMDLPSFTAEAIPFLLNYRNEARIITNFPHNPISSLYGPECKLGVYVLWTIESIRAVAVNSKYRIGRFPSLNPILAMRNGESLTLAASQKSHEIAAQAYYDWWFDNLELDDFALMEIDPLEQTAYVWR